MTTFLRRPRRWIAAGILSLLLMGTALIGPAPQQANAHTGPAGTMCGSTDVFLWWYAYQYDQNGVHYHGWRNKVTFEYYDEGPC